MKQNSFSYEQLIDCAKGVLFGKGNAQLPLPPMLMIDRITNIIDVYLLKKPPDYYFACSSCRFILSLKKAKYI